jgi:serine/threonine-protein kinase HipA
MTRELIAILDGQIIGRVTSSARARITFTYDEKWRSAPNAYPLSISMPLALTEHPHRVIESFLWNLLPDNHNILDAWARKFQVSARSAFALISAVGEDCAGAAQFVRSERLDAVLRPRSREIEWLDETAIANRLRLLREDQSAWRIPRDTGQFSLAGAQPKTALLFEDGRWGVPSGRVPTTHILKPPSTHFHGHVENEHFCLELARAIGLPVADSRIMRFQDELAIVVQRYDRVRTPAGLRRVHQEDVCQALGIPPTRKYQNEGGPGLRDIVELLNTYSSDPAQDVDTFLDAVVYNWLIAGTDAHAKNYALLIGAQSRVRLAPLYDLASILPYPEFDAQRIKLSMKIGGEYRLRDIGLRQWRKLAGEVRRDPDALVQRVRDLTAKLADTVADIGNRMADEGIGHATVTRLANALTTRAALCRQIMTA